MNEQMYSVGPIMKAARKFKKYNQAAVAQAIGCSQSALSKMEHNLLIPSAPQWFLFSRFTAIPPESLETGIIDRRAPIKLNSGEVSLGFKIPKRYRTSRAEKVREIYPFLQTLERENPTLVKEFISSTGLEPEFFLDFDNLVNFQLMTDMMSYFLKLGRGSTADIRKIVDLGQNEIYWDHYGVEWKKLTSVDEVLNEYIRNQAYFQADFQMQVEGSAEELTLTYRPELHLKDQTTQLSEELIQFLNLYRKYTIENLIKRVLGKKIEATLSEGPQTSPLGARFELRSAA
jgi:transcriptional regulator with XRE-family HTH domain